MAEEFDRYALADRLFALLAPELAAEDIDLVDVRVFRGGGRLQVRLSVDRAGGEPIDLAGCASASRSAGLLLEDADVIADAYVLEVSSPGVRRPLRTDASFADAVGRAVELRVREGAGRPRRLRGRLDAFAPGTLTLAPLADGGGSGNEAAGDDDPDADSEHPPEADVRSYGPARAIARAAVLEANLDEELDVQALINADRRRRREERRQQRQERQTQTRGRVRSKTRREDT